MKQQNKQELNATGRKILSTASRSRYDTEAINLLKDKQFLAWILHDCVEEYAGMTRDEIIPYIEDVYSAEVHVAPGLANTVLTGKAEPDAASDLTNTALVGGPTESKIPGEGATRFDIRFSAFVPTADGGLKRILFDVELQNRDKPSSHIGKRAAFHVGRMLSEQMGQNITGRDYSDMYRVYSIWACTSSPLIRANSINISSMKNRAKHGQLEGDGTDDMMRIIYIRLPDEDLKGTPKREPTELMTVLSTLFSRKKSAAEKLEILQRHGISVTSEIKVEVNTMCNLSEGIYNSGYREGRKQGCEQGRKQGYKQGQRAERQRTREAEKRADTAEEQTRAAVKRAEAAEKREKDKDLYIKKLELLLGQQAIPEPIS